MLLESYANSQMIEKATYHTFKQLDLLEGAQMHMNGDLGFQLIGQHTKNAFFVQVLFVLPLIVEPFDNAIFQCFRDASVV